MQDETTSLIISKNCLRKRWRGAMERNRSLTRDSCPFSMRLAFSVDNCGIRHTVLIKHSRPAVGVQPIRRQPHWLGNQKEMDAEKLVEIGLIERT